MKQIVGRLIAKSTFIVEGTSHITFAIKEDKKNNTFCFRVMATEGNSTEPSIFDILSISNIGDTLLIKQSQAKQRFSEEFEASLDYIKNKTMKMKY